MGVEKFIFSALTALKAGNLAGEGVALPVQRLASRAGGASKRLRAAKPRDRVGQAGVSVTLSQSRHVIFSRMCSMLFHRRGSHSSEREDRPAGSVAASGRNDQLFGGTDAGRGLHDSRKPLRRVPAPTGLLSVSTIETACSSLGRRKLFDIAKLDKGADRYGGGPAHRRSSRRAHDPAEGLAVRQPSPGLAGGVSGFRTRSNFAAAGPLLTVLSRCSRPQSRDPRSGRLMLLSRSVSALVGCILGEKL